MATSPNEREKRIALFIDFDNLALGLKQSPERKFDIEMVLDRILEKGKILVKKAYADWSRFRDQKVALHEAAIELIDIPKKRISGKNSADIRLVVDALDVAYTNTNIDSFVLLTGDSDFSPLVSKLRENDMEVVGVGMKNSSSKLLVENCDEFIYYEDIEREARMEEADRSKSDVPEKKLEAFDVVLGALRGLMREGRDVIWASMIKQTIKRKRPSFDESYHGYRSFSELLLDAEAEGILQLEKDQRSGSLLIVVLGARRERGGSSR